MIIVIANKIGRVHHAVQHPTMRKTRPVYCFVPEEFFWENGLNRGLYLVSRWPSINCSANPLAIGSHAIPDPGKPVAHRYRCPVLAEFLRRLETTANIKLAP